MSILHDAVIGELPELRALAESLMLDTFTAYSPSGRTVDGGGMEVEGYGSQGTTPGKIAGPAKLSSSRPPSRPVAVGGVLRPVVHGGLHIPVSTSMPVLGEFGVGWEYELTALGDGTDPALLNSRWLAVGAEEKSQITARRLDVVRLS